MTKFTTPDIWGLTPCEKHCPYTSDDFKVDIGEGDNILPCNKECCKFNYICYFYKLKEMMDTTNINHLVISYVDRGINDFILFGETLNKIFPNLKQLEIKQNWSYGLHDKLEDFLTFVTILNLDKLIFTDQQSSIFDELDSKVLFQLMPENAKYTIHSYERIIYSNKKHIREEKDGTKHIIWNMEEEYDGPYYNL